MGIYVHVPFCARRCGYCDFNTYPLGSGYRVESSPGVRDYLRALGADMERAAGTPGAEQPATTVYVGGGTPTILTPGQLAGILDRVRGIWGLVPGAEVSIEANPDTVTPSSLERLRAAGFTRVSFGMQSTSARVLRVLDRAHSPRRAGEAVAEARSAGFGHVSVDLIYGTPGETAEDFATSLADAVDSGVDHISAYALGVADRTPLGRRVLRGELPRPDDDEAADRYLLAERVLSERGFQWYEISNWARTPDDRCQHNLGYWRGSDWLGCGPGAHSHLNGVRWWTVARPDTYHARLTSGRSAVAGREVLTDGERHLEEVFLGLRLAEGLDMAILDSAGLAEAKNMASDGLLSAEALSRGLAVLTLRGRLLADAVTRRLLA